MTVTNPAIPSARVADEPSTTERRPRNPFKRFWPQYVAVAPFYILFLVFGMFPLIFSIWLSFNDWDGMGQMKFVGLAQYRFLITDSRFWLAVGNTFLIWIMSTIPMLFLALVIAFLLHTNIRAKGFYRVAFFIPNVTSAVAMAIVFGSIFSNSFGIINSFLNWLHVSQVPWLSNPWGIKVVIAVMVIWRWTGYNSIIYLAGLQAVSTELYEAARVDGANNWHIFSRITIPMLRPVILFTVITSTVGGLSLFTEPQVLFGNTSNIGGPADGGLTIVLYQYYQAFNQFDFGYGAAIAWALFIIAVVFAIINWRLVSEREVDGQKVFKVSRKQRAANASAEPTEVAAK
ncbi:cytochrome c biogenesis protein [Microlunatus endophyticus]|uniref:Cytochrome c biogenesis protein n=1 Tax=Microlunatus endophyticus TaxID=1716077 RepID=A0A917W3K2_9ACTN|nr:sugar ABC transporter permease [Microlunatus endophyticus]GGL58617.1 cytochrome c biogenesis protein [Microlunatus endophyticus]